MQVPCLHIVPQNIAKQRTVVLILSHYRHRLHLQRIVEVRIWHLLDLVPIFLIAIIPVQDHFHISTDVIRHGVGRIPLHQLMENWEYLFITRKLPRHVFQHVIVPSQQMLALQHRHRYVPYSLFYIGKLA